MRRRHRTILTVAVFALVVAACSGASQGDLESVETREVAQGGAGATTSPTQAAALAPDTTSAPAPAEAKDLGDSGIASVAIQPADLGRDIIFTADLSIATQDVAAAGREVTRIVEGLGGFLFGQETRGEPDAVSILTFKVPPDRFTEALERIGTVGTLRNQTVSASDVTGRIVDLESQIATIEASITRLRGFLEQATDTKAITELEDALMERETRLEQLRGQLRTLERQVALATITVRLFELQNRAAVDLGVSAYPGGDDAGLSCPGTGGSISVERGTAVTLCVEVQNPGDTRIRVVDLRDPVLDVGLDDFEVVYGVLDEDLEPGESVMLATVLEIERTLRTRTTVAVKAVGEEGEELAGRDTVANATASVELRAVAPEGVPGFFDGLQASWRFLVTLFQFALLVAGAVIPFLWVPVLVWLAVRWLSGRVGDPFRRSEPDRWEGSDAPADTDADGA